MSRTEDLHSNEGRKFTFQWTIVNLYMFGGERGHQVMSPKFNVPSLQHTEWCLKLVLQEDIKFVKCFLHRLDKGPENIKINYSLSMGSSYFLDNEWFEKNSSSVLPCSINIHELGLKVEQGLAKEFMIECHLWARDVEYILSGHGLETPYAVFCSVRTVIASEQRNFYLPLNNFWHLKNGLIKNVRIDSGGDNDATFCCELHKVSYTTLGKTFQLKFTTSNLITSRLKYRIRLVDAHKKHHSLLNGRFIFPRDGHVLTFLIPTSMLEEKDLYIPGDMLLLSCEFDVSSCDVSVSFVESTRYDSTDIEATNIVCGWGMYLENKYSEHRLLCRLLAVLIIIFSLFIPRLFTDNSV